eukprot:UN09395
MQRLWSNYAKRLNPNGGGYHVWPKYRNKPRSRPKHKRNLNFLAISGVDEFVAKSTFSSADLDNNFCSFWDQIGYAGDFSLATDLSDSPVSSNSNSQDSGLFSLLLYICFVAVVSLVAVINIIWCCCKCKSTRKKGLYSRVKNNTCTEDESID